jgi:integrase
LGDGKNAASLKQIRAALSFAYKHWDLKNPFAKIEPPLHKEPQIRYLLLADIRRLLAYLKSRQNGYGSALAFQLANALFQTACRFDELIQLSWADCQRVGEEIVALRIKGKMFSGFQLVFSSDGQTARCVQPLRGHRRICSKSYGKRHRGTRSAAFAGPKPSV